MRFLWYLNFQHTMFQLRFYVLFSSFLQENISLHGADSSFPVDVVLVLFFLFLVPLYGNSQSAVF